MTESNRYAQECKGELFATWQPITVEELLAYMGFMVLMGIVRLPRTEDYWKKDAIYHYTPIANRISRERFRELHKFLHFANNTTLAPPGTPGYDKLGKVKPIILMIGEQIASVCDPGKEVSIDEAMIPFKGRSSLKQYLPLKPIKRGIKVWTMADANTGYVSAFDIYTGKKGSTTEKGLGATVVKHLCERLYNSYRHIYYDNFFSSVDLGLDLLRSGLYSCGTLRSNRKGFPKDLKPLVKKGLPRRGDSKTYQQGNLTVSVWQDSRPVVTIATNADPTTTTSVARKNRDGTTNSYTCPHSIAAYNHYMGGVDRNDQLRGYYHVRLKCRKFYKYIFWFLFDLSITNAYILYHSHPDNHRKRLIDFRTTLATELIGSYSSRKRPGRSSISRPLARRFCQAHYPMKASSGTAHRCHYCHNNRHERRSTTWQCKDCDVYLCHFGHPDSDCFRKYHMELARRDDN